MLQVHTSKTATLHCQTCDVVLNGSNEWEDDLNARLYNAPGTNLENCDIVFPDL